MKRNTQDADEVVKQAWSSASQQQVETAKQRVLGRLRSSPSAAVPADSSRAPHRVGFRNLTLASVAAVAIIAVVIWIALPTPVAVAGTSLYRMRAGTAQMLKTGDPISIGDVLRADSDMTSIVALPNGSRIEMKSNSEISLEAADDGVKARLRSGSLIVNAPRETSTHLYIETKDVRVPAAAGNVFLVNAEEEGSRVGSIGGELQVQQGSVARTLLPGSQVSTSPRLEPQLISEGIQWSRNLEMHLALLQQATAPSPSERRFAAVSIRTSHQPRPPQNEPLGFGCRGIDGLQRNAGTGPVALVVPQGRCVGNWVTFAELMNQAFAAPWRYGANIPEWARHEGTLQSGQGADRFQIEAVAEDPTTATREQLREMLRNTLADRFKLKIHREQQEVQSFALAIAKGGLKIREANGAPEEPSFQAGVIKGKSSMDDFARFLTTFFISFTNLGYLDYPVIDKSGLKGIYEYQFELRPQAGARGQSSDGPPSRSSRISDFAATVSVILEDELGLRLQPEKITTEVIVLDSVENPSVN